MTEIRIHAPDAEQVWMVIDGVDRPLTRTGSEWRGSVAAGTRYGIRARGPAEARFDERRVLVDPHATEVWFADGHRRDDLRPGRYPANGAPAVLAVASPWLVLLFMSFQSEVIHRYASPGGVVVLAAGGGLCLVAYRLMMRIGRLPVERRILS